MSMSADADYVIDRLSEHQDECTARLQEQISTLIVKQDYLEHQLAALAVHQPHHQPHGRRTLHEHPHIEPPPHTRTWHPPHSHHALENQPPTDKKTLSEDHQPHVACGTTRASLRGALNEPSSMAQQHHRISLQKSYEKPTSKADQLHTEPNVLDEGEQQALLKEQKAPTEPTGTVSQSLAPPTPPKSQAPRVSAANFMRNLAERKTMAPLMPTREECMKRANTANPHKMRFSQEDDVLKYNAELVEHATSTMTFRTKRDQSSIAKFVRSKYFDQICAFFLVTNTCFIGIQVEYAATRITDDLPLAYVIVDFCYGFWFIAELLLRIKAAGWEFVTDVEEKVWNIFDAAIVILCSVEMFLALFLSSGPLKTLSAVRMIRVIRIARIARVIRLMRFFRSLRILLAAIFSTLKSCLWTAMLLGMILYGFGVIFVQGVAEHRVITPSSDVNPELIVYFGTLPRGIFTMFKSVLGGLDWQTAVEPLSDMNGMYVMLFVLMITFVYLAVLNVVQGLFLQSALEHAQSDREDQIRHQITEKERYVKTILSLFAELDDNLDGEVTLREFEEHLNEQRMVGFFEALEIEAADAWTLFKLLDVDRGGSVSVAEFVDGCLKIKGNAKGVQIAQIMYENKWMMDAVFELTEFVDTQFEAIQDYLGMQAVPIINEEKVPAENGLTASPPSRTSSGNRLSVHVPSDVNAPSQLHPHRLPDCDLNPDAVSQLVRQHTPDDHTVITALSILPTSQSTCLEADID